MGIICFASITTAPILNVVMVPTNRRKPRGFDARLAHSVALLRKGERLALSYSDGGYYLAFSGGKDSQALYYLAKMAGVQFDAHYSLTTLDPPEVVHFIRDNYTDVEMVRPAMTFAQLCIKKKALPTRLMRFCCAVLKETRGYGRVVLTGVRKAESVNRSRRNETEVISRNKERRFSATYEQFDQFSREKEIEGVSCVIGKDRIVINPLIEWTEDDVWYFLDAVIKAPHCSLYDIGWHRIGCLFCPMASRREIKREVERYPRYYALILRTIHRLRENGYLSDYSSLSDEDVFRWWISKESLEKWFAAHKLELNLF